MKRPLGDMCADIARYAAARDHEFLAHLLRIAAAEADASAPGETFALPAIAPKDLVIGLWDWDVPNNIRHLDETGASMFGYPKRAQFSEQDLTARMTSPNGAARSSRPRRRAAPTRTNTASSATTTSPGYAPRGNAPWTNPAGRNAFPGRSSTSRRPGARVNALRRCHPFVAPSVKRMSYRPTSRHPLDSPGALCWNVGWARGVS